MKSKRLEAIFSFIRKGSVVADIGCDHGYLGISLMEKGIASKVIMSDISSHALESAISNCKKKHLEIPCYVSDGLKDIPMEGVDTLTISGMGSLTMQEILNSPKIDGISYMVLQSNNHLQELRTFLNKIGFYLEDEATIYEKGKWYVICSFIRSDLKNTKSVLKYGYPKKDKIEYYQNWISKNEVILKKLPFFSKISLWKENYTLKKLLKECQG